MYKKLFILVFLIFIISACTKNECDKFNTAFEKNDCEIKKAINNNDLSRCGEEFIREEIEIVNPSDQCYIGIAVSRKNYSICENNLSEQDTKMYCLAYFAKSNQDPDICNKEDISQDDKDVCYSYLAQLQNDDIPCAKIINSEKSDFCYFQVATTEWDESKCEKIKDTNKKDKCIEAIEYHNNKN